MTKYVTQRTQAQHLSTGPSAPGSNSNASPKGRGQPRKRRRKPKAAAQFTTKSYVDQLAWSPDQQNLAVCSATTGWVRVWALDGTELLAVKGGTLMFGVSALAFNRDGSLLATGAASGHVRLWNRADGARVLDCRQAFGQVAAIGFNPAGELLYVAAKALNSCATGKPRTVRRFGFLRPHLGCRDQL